MVEDSELLRRYVEFRSEEAFAELVRRRIGLVYSVALRRTRDAHLADDVTQTVFSALARKAAALSNRSILAGWLHRSAHLAAAAAMRGERNRAMREKEADIMNRLNTEDARDADWQRLRPVLDEALSEIDECDRDAVLLRFFDGRPFAEIG